MSAQNRQNRILSLLVDRGEVAIEEIAAHFGVSTATARRDLNALAEQRLVSRTHGGAISAGTAYELPLQYKNIHNDAAKVAIARRAAALVAPGDVVGLTGGTTTTEIARHLARAEHLQADSGVRPGVTIVTNALNIAYELAIRPQIKVVMTGGVARRQTFELVGPLAHASVQGMRLDWAFIGVGGVHHRFGVTTGNEEEASVNALLASRAEKALVVADASKMGQTSFAHVCDIAQLDGIITDRPLPTEVADEAAAHDVEVWVATND